MVRLLCMAGQLCDNARSHRVALLEGLGADGCQILSDLLDLEG